jgi:Zn-dependent peptidase ImmA (M78 family)
MNTTAKGNKLEDAFHKYLLDQQRRGALVFGAHHPATCLIHKKKTYFSKERDGYIEFDIVIEIIAEGRTSPHLVIVFECKNYSGDVPEVYVREFSDKLKELFPNGAKGVIVTSSRLQSGADKVARSRGMGIVKYDEHGLDVVADRKGQTCLEKRFVSSQLFRTEAAEKSLRFSAYHEGTFFGSLRQFLGKIAHEFGISEEGQGVPPAPKSVPFVPFSNIKAEVAATLELINYKSGPVDLMAICSALSIDLTSSEETVLDADGAFILGSANFTRNSITVYPHGNENRQRFTVAHEIGHFCLQHRQYLKAETIVAADLMLGNDTDNSFNYDRLEFQANVFASLLVLPDETFRIALDVARHKLNIKDRSHGYVYVDDQPQNYGTYQEMLFLLSDYFEVSRQVIEIRLKSLGLLNDQRKYHSGLGIGKILENFMLRGS